MTTTTELKNHEDKVVRFKGVVRITTVQALDIVRDLTEEH